MDIKQNGSEIPEIRHQWTNKLMGAISEMQIAKAMYNNM
jgi:hypothetical protein